MWKCIQKYCNVIIYDSRSCMRKKMIRGLMVFYFSYFFRILYASLYCTTCHDSSTAHCNLFLFEPTVLHFSSIPPVQLPNCMNLIPHHSSLVRCTNYSHSAYIFNNTSILLWSKAKISKFKVYVRQIHLKYESWTVRSDLQPNSCNIFCLNVHFSSTICGMLESFSYSFVQG